jgi:hypothetical protein
MVSPVAALTAKPNATRRLVFGSVAAAWGSKVALLRTCAASVAFSSRVRVAYNIHHQISASEEVVDGTRAFRARFSSSWAASSPTASSSWASSSVLSKSASKMSSSSASINAEQMVSGALHTLIVRIVRVLFRVLHRLVQLHLRHCGLHSACNSLDSLTRQAQM